jgi:hypothetical protein
MPQEPQRAVLTAGIGAGGTTRPPHFGQKGFDGSIGVEQ